MGFYGYGNRSDVQKNTSFVFDKIYPNRKAMEEGIADDGVYVGRHVLIEYDIEASSLDFKKAYFNGDADLIQGYNILYFSADLANVTRILYDENNNTIENNIIYTTTKDTIVYIIQNNQNKYYKCVGYVGIDPEDESKIIIEIKGNANSYTSPLVAQFEKDVKYALFQEIDGAISSDAANNYAANYNIDVAWAASKKITMSGHGWDSTVWEKTIVQDVEKYVMIAELNTVVPTFAISADAPTQTPLTPHFDTASTDVYYNLHWQPQWGMRVQLADASESEASAIIEPGTDNILSDDTTTWIKTTYNKDTGRTELYYFTKNGNWQRISGLSSIGEDGKLPAAVYYNKAGFSASQRYHSSLKDSIGVNPTGISGREYNTHTSGKTAIAPDIQEISMVLPSIGNAISDMWDIVYGDANKEDNSSSPRMTDIAWLSSPVYNDRRRLQLIETKDGKNYDYNVSEVETLAGSINSVHDLMGMIIIEEDEQIENLDEYAINKAQGDSIYFLNNKFYRKAPVKQYTELTEGEYVFTLASGLDEDHYNTYSYYIKNEDGSYSQATEPFDASTEYYKKEVEGKMTQVELTTFEDIMKAKNTYYLYRNGNNDYIYDTQYVADRQYFTIDKDKVTYVGQMDDSYEPNKFYYEQEREVGSLTYTDYYLDTAEINSTNIKEYSIKATPKLARKIYVPGTWYSRTEDSKYVHVYSLDSSGYKSNQEYYYITQLLTMQDAAEALEAGRTLVYKQKAKVHITKTILGEDRKIYYYIADSEPNIQQEVWLNASSGKYYPTALAEPKLDKDFVDLDNGSVRPAYKYVVDSPVKYVTYQGDGTNITQDVSTERPIFYTLNPWDAEYQSANELYLVNTVSGLYLEINKETYYRLDENNNYIRITHNSEVPSYFSEDETKFYTLEITDASDYPFYQNNKYYYQSDDDKLSWYFDKNGSFVENRLYYTLPEEAVTGPIDVGAIIKKVEEDEGKVIYEKGKYYYLINNRYMVDNALTPTTERNYFKGQDDYVVYSDSKGILVIGSHWNTGLPIPHFVTLGRNDEDTYRMEELVGFARSLNTIHGLILQINTFLEYGNETTRDTSTVQGTLNKLNDIIAKFNLIDWGQVAVTDAYGRLHTAPFETDDWVKAYVDPDVENPIIHINHTYNPVEDTTEVVDMNTNAEDKLILTELIPDDMGHIVNKNTKTVTLPSGIKKITADSGEYIAGTTQAAFEIKTADDWLNTAINGNRLDIAHEDPQSAVNTKGLLSDASPSFGSSFVIPKVSIDGKGHVQELAEFTLTLPQGSLTKAENGNTVVDITFIPETGALVETKELAGNLVLGVYDSSASGSIAAEDSIAAAIAKTNSSLVAAKETLEQSIANLTSTNANEHNAIINSITQLTNDNTSAHTDLQNSINTLSSANSQEHTTLQGNINTLSGEFTSFKNEVQNYETSTNEELSALKQQDISLQGDITQLQALITALTDRVTALENLSVEK